MQTVVSFGAVYSNVLFPVIILKLWWIDVYFLSKRFAYHMITIDNNRVISDYLSITFKHIFCGFYMHSSIIRKHTFKDKLDKPNFSFDLDKDGRCGHKILN